MQSLASVPLSPLLAEIAEVETVRNTLKKRLLKKRIIAVKVLYPQMIESDVNEFKKNLEEVKKEINK